MLDEAVKAFIRTLEIQPDNAKAHYNIGTIYYNYDKVDKAIKALEKSKQLNSNFTLVYSQL